MDRLNARSWGTGQGMSGDPTTLRKSWSSAVAEAAPSAVARSKAWSLSQARMLAPPAPRRLSAPGALMSISSGMGTSSTVSRESSRSRFGHSFLIYTATSLPRINNRAELSCLPETEERETSGGREGKGREGQEQEHVEKVAACARNMWIAQTTVVGLRSQELKRA
jgi:hypothetical protein